MFMICPICESKKKRKIFFFQETDLDNKKKYNLFRCKSCGLIRPSPLPYNEVSKKSVYNKPKEKIEIDYESLESKHYLKNFKPYADYIQKNKIKGSHLDIGCGGGFLLYLTKKNGLKSEGIELNANAVKTLTEKGFIVHEKELGHKVYKGKKYNLITANHVLEHIEDLHSFLQEVNKLLDKEGYFIVAFPFIHGLIPQILRTRWYGQGYGTHLNFFSIKNIKQLLKQNEFKVVEIKISSMDYTTYKMPKPIKKFVKFICNTLIYFNLGDNLFVVAKKNND